MTAGALVLFLTLPTGRETRDMLVMVAQEGWSTVNSQKREPEEYEVDG